MQKLQPFINNLFKTNPLSLKELAVCIGAAVFVFLTVELKKLIEGRFRLKKENAKPQGM